MQKRCLCRRFVRNFHNALFYVVCLAFNCWCHSVVSIVSCFTTVNKEPTVKREVLKISGWRACLQTNLARSPQILIAGSVRAARNVSPNWSQSTNTCHSSNCFSIVWGQGNTPHNVGFGTFKRGTLRGYPIPCNTVRKIGKYRNTVSKIDEIPMPHSWFVTLNVSCIHLSCLFISSICAPAINLSKNTDVPRQESSLKSTAIL